MDPDAVRTQHRELWERAASSWALGREIFDTATEPVSRWMLGAIEPQPGQTVLELAAGAGELGFRAAAALEPGGTLICTDGAEAMLEVAGERAAALGIANVEFVPMELEWIDRETASVDAILCRFGLMLAVDREAAAREMRRVLRPGGRLAVGVWDEPAANPWLIALSDALIEGGHMEEPAPGVPGAFSLSGQGELSELLQDAGFVAPDVAAVDIAFEFSSLDTAWEAMLTLSTRMRDAVGGLSPADHYRVRESVEQRWDPFIAPGGSLTLPGRALCAAAEA